ncbi:UNVERIFIED_CONTAM: hypothetical protein H355_014598 [Colinus virginianus]|nr:hypothetical protein H355_014598 [Colinus virginianus]
MEEARGASAPAEKKKQAASKDHGAKVSKAKKVAKGLKKAHSIKKTRVRRNVHFFRPTTLKQRRNPKVLKHASDGFESTFPKLQKLDKFALIRHPLTTESAMKRTEETNTLVFIVHPRSNKRQIKQAVKQLYDVDAMRVNTLIRPDGTKKAYVRLTPDYDALDVANKMGII